MPATETILIRVDTLAEAAGFSFNRRTHLQVIVSQPVGYEPGTEDASGEPCYDRQSTNLFRAFDRRLIAAGYRHVERGDGKISRPGLPDINDGEFHVYRLPRRLAGL